MSTVHRQAGRGLRVYVKGAPQEVLPRCTRIVEPDGIAPLSKEAKNRVTGVNDAHARAALRVLAFAYRDLQDGGADGSAEDVEQDLVFLGLIAMLDAPRPEVAQAVTAAHRAGIRILMITGDYGLTAEAIARRLGIVRGQNVRILAGGRTWTSWTTARCSLRSTGRK